MSEINPKANESLSKAKTPAKREGEVSTYRTILIAASVGVLVGLLLRR